MRPSRFLTTHRFMVWLAVLLCACCSVSALGETLPAHLTQVDSEAFADNHSLQLLVVPDGTLSIGARAFSGCSSLVSAVIPRSVQSIGENAFADCPSVEIYGYISSEAQRYALDAQLPFYSLDLPCAPCDYISPSETYYTWNYRCPEPAYGLAVTFAPDFHLSIFEYLTISNADGDLYTANYEKNWGGRTLLVPGRAVSFAFEIASSSAAFEVTEIRALDEAEYADTQEQLRFTPLQLETHSEADIRAFLAAHPFDFGTANTYNQSPLLTAPYSPGQLSEEAQQMSLNCLNTLRYIAGIPADVTLSAEYCGYAQAGAMVNAVNQTLSHYPSQPADMSDELYETAYTGTSCSNIAFGYGTLTSAMMGCMADADSGNRQRVGHRRWFLCPRMGSFGVGAARSYSAFYVLDVGRENGRSYPYVAWPAQLTPTSLFASGVPWSFSICDIVDDATVTLMRRSDGRVWSFSKDSPSGTFYIENGNYGYLQCIIFVPSGATVNNGDVYDVYIQADCGEDGTYEFQYSVSFFDMPI